MHDHSRVRHSFGSDRYGSPGSDVAPAGLPPDGPSNSEDIPTFEAGPSVPIDAGGRGERAPEVMPDVDSEERL